jgi:hypothetical protein
VLVGHGVQVGRSPPGEDARQLRAQLSVMAVPVVGGREPGVAEQGARAGRLAQRRPGVVGEHGQAGPGVLPGQLVEAVQRGQAALAGVEPGPLDCGAVGPAEGVGGQQQGRVDDRGADALALPGALAVVQRLRHRDRPQVAVAGVAHVHPAPQRRRAQAAGAVLVFRSGQGVGGLVGAGPGRARAVLEAAGVAVNELREPCPQLLVTEAEPLGRTGPHVVRHDVRRRQQPVEDLAPGWVLEVERDAALAPVGGQPHVGAGPVAVVQGVHLDHVGAEVGQDPAAPGAGDAESEVEHLDAVQRAARQRPPGFPGRSGCGRPGCRRSRRLVAAQPGQHLGGVLPGTRRRASDRAGGRGELQEYARMPDRAELGVVHLDHAALLEQRRVAERLLGGSDEGDAEAARDGRRRPTARWETCGTPRWSRP